MHRERSRTCGWTDSRCRAESGRGREECLRDTVKIRDSRIGRKCLDPGPDLSFFSIVYDNYFAKQ